MATEIELPDGTVLEAPDGADPSKVAKEYLAKNPQKPAAPQAEKPGWFAGLGNELYGAAKGAAGLIPGASDLIKFGESEATGKPMPAQSPGIGVPGPYGGATAAQVGRAEDFGRAMEPKNLGPAIATGAKETLSNLTGPKDTAEQQQKFGESAFNVIGGIKGAMEIPGLARKAVNATKSGETILGEALPETIKHHEVAAKSAGLPASDSIATPAGGDIESDMRKVSSSRYDALKSTQQTQGNAAFDRYRSVGASKEKAGQFFTVSPSGQKLIEELSTIEAGGKGAATEYNTMMRKSAKKLREALSGVAEDGRHPANLDVVDQELRNLREIQYDTSPTGYSAVKRANVGKLADKLEAAVKQWVGDENYPRAEYAALSDDLNKWNSKLGKSLRGKEKIDYVSESEAGYANKGKVAAKAFANNETASEFRNLVGDQEYQRLAERHVSNTLRGKSAEQAAQWVDQQQWLKSTPDSMKKAVDYVRIMAEREGDAARLRWVKKKLAQGAGIAAAGALAGEGAKSVYSTYEH